MNARLSWLTQLLLVAYVGCFAASERCEEVLIPAKELSHAYVCRPSPIWELQHLWSPVTVTLACSSADYEVHVGSDIQDVLTKIEKGADPVWCGWHSFWEPNECKIRPSPYETKYMAVKRTDASGIRFCQQSESQQFSAFLPALGAAGAVLFLYSDFLSASPAFRLSSGTAIFTTLSLAILMIFIFRALPHKRKVAAAFFAMGSTTISITRWLYGKWLPSMRDVVQSPIFIVYVAISAVVGLVLTYLFDNPANTKLNTILRVGLRALGLTCLFFSTTSTYASLAITIALTAYRLWTWLQRHRYPQLYGDAAAPLTPGAHATPLREDGHLEPETSAHRTPLTFPPAPACSSTSLPDRTMTLRLRTPPPTPPQVQARMQRHAPSPYNPHHPAMVTPPPPHLGPEDSAESADIRSPLVRQGLIVNGRTGKTIKLGGLTFNNLVSQGYTPDYVQGMLTPPEGQISGGGAGLLSPRPSGGRGRGRRGAGR